MFKVQQIVAGLSNSNDRLGMIREQHIAKFRAG
jgi:hypothetical protein